MQPPADYLPSILPELRTFRLVIDFQPGEAVLVPGDFIVSVGKSRKVGTVYQIIERHNVKSRVNRYRYRFQVVKCPELKEKVTVNFRFHAFIAGQSQQVVTIIWNPRNKKK